MIELIPAILAHTAEEAQDKCKIVEKATPWMQLDVIDGSFAPNTTWHDAHTFSTWNLPLQVELDLMVMDPRRVIEEWLVVPTFKRAIWHVECAIDHQALIDFCRTHGLEIGLSLNPNTPIETVRPFLHQIDTILLLGVQPGFSGQILIRQTLQTLSNLHASAPNLPIEFDGGLTLQTISSVIAAGAARLCMSSAIFDTPDPWAAIQGIQQQILACADTSP